MTDHDRTELLLVDERHVCRAPFAEHVLSAVVPPPQGSEFRIRSAGLHAVPETRMDRATADLVCAYGGDPWGHRPRPLRAEDLDRAALVLTMTRAQRQDVVHILPSAITRVFTLRQFGRIIAAAAPTDTPVFVEEREEVRRLAELADLAIRHRGRTAPASARQDDVLDCEGRRRSVRITAVRQMLPALTVLSLQLGGQPVVPLSERQPGLA